MHGGVGGARWLHARSVRMHGWSTPPFTWKTKLQLRFGLLAKCSIGAYVTVEFGAGGGKRYFGGVGK